MKIQTIPTSKKPTLISVVLPQFHPIPENDQWWGKGFTEWRNVIKSTPQFKNHYQPHLPADLGFYDLRLSETRLQQAELAKNYGIGGFCYYHYWFHGHQLLERPVKDILESEKPNFPFCLCWANENWSRAWNGGDREILIEQKYSDEDDLHHIEALIPYFLDPRYIRIDGKPVFIIYKANQLPNPKKTFEKWREIAIKRGVGEICLAQFESGGDNSTLPPEALGLDLSIEFTPDWRRLGGQYYTTTKAKIAISLGLLPQAYKNHRIFDYELMANKILRKPQPSYPFIRCVSPGFDNSARRKNNATILINSSPQKYQTWLEGAINWTLQHNKPEHQFIFINAWNEWAEGNHLEPDEKYGKAYLEATSSALNSI
jgi:lipopolysaccharide biosynthesis protein